MTRWLRNKCWFLIWTILLLSVCPSTAQQPLLDWGVDPLSMEAVLLPDPLPVHVLQPETLSSASSVPTALPTSTPIMLDMPLADKKELDEAMTAKIERGSVEPLHPLDPTSLVLHRMDSADIVRTEGEIFWIEQLSGDLYFSTANDTLQTLWTKDYPAQSLSNLLLGQVDRPQFGIDLTHRRYGTVKPRFHVEWASLYNTLCAEEVRRYASGVLLDGGKSLRGVLIVHHPNGNYVDMLVITTTIDELFAPEGQRKDLRGDLFTNVPQQNILNLYE